MSALLARWAAAAARGLGSKQVASFRKVPYYGTSKVISFIPDCSRNNRCESVTMSGSPDK